MKHMVAAAGVVIAAGTLPILAASPASATQSACTNYVATHGYFAGPKVKAACAHGAIDAGVTKAPNPACIVGLAKLDVANSVSVPACKRA
ncbi:hypothetical protein K4749_16350 [Streptomyces sp. TRM72054]|uniref:hypothetical protein n=1 Tax=Streptomyces sp. TRM72054 TaxID=2870562 RepID=UPI001C8C18B9|nr:hypothetical protein [Streptomyces sp. TRM72054]MBX9395123.1 hypothetical protein [Streptomyces sp. TRM72054]